MLSSARVTCVLLLQGKAQGIIRLLLGTKHHSVSRRTYLPAELTAPGGVSQEEIYRLQDTDALREVFLQVASTARAHHTHAVELNDRLKVCKTSTW